MLLLLLLLLQVGLVLGEQLAPAAGRPNRLSHCVELLLQQYVHPSVSLCCMQT